MPPFDHPDGYLNSNDQADEIERLLEQAGLTVAVNPTDPQIKLQVWYLVACAGEGCEWDEYSPGDDTEAGALQSATADFDMTRHTDGKLYCEPCTQRITAKATCAEQGHDHTDWQTDPMADALVKEYRYCQRCYDHESRPAVGGRS